MANTLTSLIPDAYAALDVVSRELVGFIPAVMRDSSADQVALNQTLRSPATAANTAAFTITPAMAIPAAADQTISNKSLTITKTRGVPFSWSGEEQYAMNRGPGFNVILQDQIAQGLRALVNEIEVDIAVAAGLGASRAFGAAAGTAPLFTDWAQAKKILDDNGAPISMRSSVVNTTAGVALRSTSNLYKVNEGGDATLLRQGVLGNLFGIDIRESAQIQTTTAGTGASYTTTAAGFAVGTTSIPIITGTGTVLAGDIVIFAGDTNKYVVATGVAAPGTIVLAAPGLQVAMSAATKAMTILGTSTRNFAFSRNAITLATRLPMIPEGGDLRLDSKVITDDRSGISFELSLWPGQRMNRYEVSACWGVTVFKPEHLAIIVG